MKTILLIAACAVMMLTSCSKDKEAAAPHVKLTPHVYVKQGQSVYTIQLRSNATIKSAGTITVSWTSDGGSLSRVNGTFSFNNEQTYEFPTTISKNQWPGVNNVKVESISGSGGYNFVL